MREPAGRQEAPGATWVGRGTGQLDPRAALRSPDALAHDPPVRKVSWTVEQDASGDAFVDDARRRLADEQGLDETGWDRLMRHAGLHAGVHRVEPERPPPRVPAGTSAVAYLLEREPRALELPDDAVLHDEEGLVIACKPPWFTTQGSRASRLSSLERRLRERLDCPELRPCNRLDRETSGLVIFARTSPAASLVGKQLQQRTVEKEYLCAVHPEPPAERWEATWPLIRVTHPSHSLFDVTLPDEPGSRAAETHFTALRAESGRTLVRARPVTGRTHQIRVHAAASGCPIVGDSLYGRGWSPEAPPWSAARLQLHAERVVLRGADGRPLEFAAAPPPDFGLGAT